MKNEIENFLRPLINGLIKHTNDLKLECTEAHGRLFVSVKVHAADHPRLVGKQGSNFNAFRFLLACWGANKSVAVNYVLSEPHTGRAEPALPFRPTPDFDTEPMRKLLQQSAKAVCPNVSRVDSVQAGDTTHLFLVPPAPEEIRDALHKVFHAIGKNLGHMVYVDNGTEAK